MFKAPMTAAAALLALSGCGSSDTDSAAAPVAATSETAQPEPTPPAPPRPAPTTPTANAPASDADPDVSTPMPVPLPAPAPPPGAPKPPPAPPPPPPPPLLMPDAQKGEKGARAVLLTWARALENRQFGTAWAQFGHPPSSRAAFSKWWQRYRTIDVAVGDGDVEGAAGSLYYQVQATLTGTDTQGKRYRLQGPVTLRRVNDVDGATPAQLRWHIDSADLKAVPVR